MYVEKVSEEWKGQEKCNASNKFFNFLYDKKHTLN